MEMKSNEFDLITTLAARACQFEVTQIWFDA
jgi:hypothetical protein